MSFKLTAITATYNREGLLPRCIESVASQTYPYKEHVIIDGGSTDGTVSIIKSYASKYPHIKWLSERDTGIPSACNKGLAMSSGDAIGVIGDDDFYTPDAFGIVASEFERDPDAALVSGNCALISNDLSVTATQKASFTNRRDLLQCWRHWGKRVAIAAPSTFIRRRVIDEVGGFDETRLYASDYDHWIRITEKFPKVRIVDTVLAKFRFDEGGSSFSDTDEQWREVMAISKKHWGSKRSLLYYQILLSYLQYYQWPLFKGVVRKRILTPRMLTR
jgi:glycosyltransferase involved in cell wall biosynthesis